MPRDNVEKFAFIYEMDEKSLAKSVSRSDKIINSFVTVATKGFSAVVDTANRMTGAFTVFGGMAGKIIKGVFVRHKDALFQFGNRVRKIVFEMELLEKMGGLSGVLLGPLGFLLKPLNLLLKPITMLIDLVSGALQPAMELIQGHLKVAFVPLAMAFERLAVKVIPILIRLIDPVVKLLENLVDEFAGMLGDRGFGEMFEVVDDLVSLIDEMATTFVRDFLKPISGVLFKTVIKMFVSLAKFAVEFVKTLKPYMPDFLNLLSRIAHVIIESFGDSFSDLMDNLGEMLPGMEPTIEKILNTFKELVPELIKAIPQIFDLFQNVISKFFVPATCVIIQMIVDGLLELLKKAPGAVSNLSEFIKKLNTWWKTSDQKMRLFWADMKGMGKGIVGFIRDAVDATKELIRLGRLYGIIEENAAERRRQELADMGTAKHFRATQIKQLDELVKKRKKEGEELADISIWYRQQRMLIERRADQITKSRQELLRKHARERAREEAGESASARKRQVSGIFVQPEQDYKVAARPGGGYRVKIRQEGGYIARPEISLIGDRPEWIVPDTPAGLTRYIPMMLKKALHGTPSPPTGSSDRFLRDIRDILKSIELLLQTQDDLPEML